MDDLPWGNSQGRGGLIMRIVHYYQCINTYATTRISYAITCKLLPYMDDHCGASFPGFPDIFGYRFKYAELDALSPFDWPWNNHVSDDFLSFIRPLLIASNVDFITHTRVFAGGAEENGGRPQELPEGHSRGPAGRRTRETVRKGQYRLLCTYQLPPV